MSPRLNKRTPSGTYERQSGGFQAFFPAPLPPNPLPSVSGALATLMSRADQGLGRLDGIVSTLPNPDLFLAMYVKQEAVLSSQIEGTQASLSDVLAYEADDGTKRLTEDVEEVVNYVAALNLGMDLIADEELTTSVLRRAHQRLMKGVRGGDKQPGRIRTTQNFIGSRDGSIETAAFIPPPPTAVPELLENLESFMEGDDLPALAQAAYAHAQFETIHPFLDGNGRIGRLLIILILARRGVLARALLYVSLYLKAHRAEYYDRLQAVRTKGDWSGWFEFFLRAVIDVAQRAVDTARAVLDLRERMRAKASKAKRRTASVLRALDELFLQPITTASHLSRRLEVSYQTANLIIVELVRLRVLREATGYKRNRQFAFKEYVALFESGS